LSFFVCFKPIGGIDQQVIYLKFKKKLSEAKLKARSKTSSGKMRYFVANSASLIFSHDQINNKQVISPGGLI